VEAASSIPWSAIVAMRNRLIHVCFEIDNNVLWRTAKQEAPKLIASLENLLASDG